MNVSPEDYAELAVFLAAFPDDESRSAESWLDRMQAWWDLNPAYVDSFARGWVLRDGGKIVGFFGSIPWKFQSGGNETTVFAGTTWRVLPEFRGMSMALKRREMDEHRDVLHFSTTPRAEVARMLEVLGYEPIRRDPDDGSHSAIIVNFEKVLRIKLQNVFPGKALAKCLAPVVSAIQSFRIRRLEDYGQGKVRELTSAGEAFDDLWNRTRMKYPNTNVRTADAINWYCFSSKGIQKKLLGYFEGDKLAGYMVCMSSEMRGMKFYECVDLWIERAGGRAEVLGALVARARQCAERDSCDRVFLPHFNRETAASYNRLGLPAMRALKRPEFYKGPRRLMQQITTGNSYFVLAQGDYGL
ncbi:MAG: hypothetical protein WD795_02060 [Woeseia sp.]